MIFVKFGWFFCEFITIFFCYPYQGGFLRKKTKRLRGIKWINQGVLGSLNYKSSSCLIRKASRKRFLSFLFALFFFPFYPFFSKPFKRSWGGGGRIFKQPWVEIKKLVLSFVPVSVPVPFAEIEPGWPDLTGAAS